MNHNSPLTPHPFPLFLSPLAGEIQRVASADQLRELGIPAGEVAARCRRPSGWQQLLPGVFLLRPGPPTGEDRLRAALLYAEGSGTASPSRETGAMITGSAALVLHGFASAPPLTALERIDVLVSRSRRLRSSGWVRIVRTADSPEPLELAGVPVAPAARAVADAVPGLADPEDVRRLLAEAVRDGHCEPGVLARELSRARLLSRPYVADAVEALLAEGRSQSEERLYTMVREFGLPDPVWDVELRLPGGPLLGGVDAYWPDQAVVVELDTRLPRQDDEALWSAYSRKRERLERLGITVVHLTPRKLREAMDQQATVVRTALMAAPDRHPAAYVVALPR
ncbi:MULTISPECIES: hypothetical protein [unclassified Streptomyces]|uniref:hypothetical protein n=1 Tax=unclassified Streptomyces TaxID=2593676 RepID=UPI0016607995|nr:MULTISPECIES: hypothetical protein [unclassified Streptomyces]MBD0709711.1 hypothetical protein [Streptomyces sp. CBMA291]MBD0715324.1 hypothetical protein [Streptomyces sp. CBMA370]